MENWIGVVFLVMQGSRWTQRQRALPVKPWTISAKVSAVCKEINLTSEIDRIVGVDPRQKVSCGEAVVAMVLNSLGFVDRPLY